MTIPIAFCDLAHREHSARVTPLGISMVASYALKKFSGSIEAKVFKLWEQHINSLGNKLDIHAGIAGPASLKILVSYAKSCGVGNSIRFLSKQVLNIKKITTTKTPDKLIGDLAEYKYNYPSSKLTKLHLYPFGGMKKTSQWMNKKSINLKKTLDCQPCMQRTCPLGHHKCMKLIKAVDVLDSLKSFK